MELQKSQEPTSAQHWIYDGQRSRPARGPIETTASSASVQLYERKDDGGYVVHVFHFDIGTVFGPFTAPDGGKYMLDAQGRVSEVPVAEPTN